jgi:hypothetical protein|nr:MAG TPA: hypothetical protein [Caudoviricetes sp.]
MEIEKFIEIVEDKSMLEYGLRVLMQAAETKKMPEEAYMPTFNDEMLEEAFMAVLEKIVNS